jgi:hypothetical protein
MKAELRGLRGNLLTTGAMTNTWDAANRLIETATGNLQLTPQYGNPVFQSPELSASQPYNWEIIPKVVY